MLIIVCLVTAAGIQPQTTVADLAGVVGPCPPPRATETIITNDSGKNADCRNTEIALA